MAGKGRGTAGDGTEAGDQLRRPGGGRQSEGPVWRWQGQDGAEDIRAEIARRDRDGEVKGSERHGCQ